MKRPWHLRTQSEIGEDAPLHSAMEEITCPYGSMAGLRCDRTAGRDFFSLAGLRREAGRVLIERTVGRDFITLAATETMKVLRRKPTRDLAGGAGVRGT